MDYLSSMELAEKWGVSPRRVIRLAREGRIPQAKFVGKNWVFPENTEKPADGRRRAEAGAEAPEERRGAEAAAFRFPLLANSDIHSFHPPLSREELKLRNAQIDFYACRYEEAESEFLELEGETKDVSVRISALYYLCLISVYAHGGSLYESRRAQFDSALASDFPHKKELELTAYWLDMDIGWNQSIYEKFGIDEEYSYDPSVYYILAFLSALSETNGDLSFFSNRKFNVYEVLAKQAEHDGHYMEAVQLNMLAFSAYYFQANHKKMHHYLNAALQIAEERQLYSVIITYESIYPAEFKAALPKFSPEFADKIISLGEQFHESYSKFMKRYNSFNTYTALSSSDYAYLFYATQSFSNNRVAELTGLTKSYVANRYSEIYLKLGVRSKKELVDLCRKTLSDPR